MTRIVLDFAQGLDVTRVLSRVTVTCISAISPKWFVEPLVVSEPPFSVESTTDVPFLARVTLDWNGQNNTQTMVEHWVQVPQRFCARESLPANSILVSPDRSPENRLRHLRSRATPRYRTRSKYALGTPTEQHHELADTPPIDYGKTCVDTNTSRAGIR